MARTRKGRPVHGWVIVDKPAGIGSTEVVNKDGDVELSVYVLGVDNPPADEGGGIKLPVPVPGLPEN